MSWCDNDESDCGTDNNNDDVSGDDINVVFVFTKIDLLQKKRGKQNKK